MRKMLYFLSTLPFMLIPTELFILFWIILKPITFWQKLVSIVMGIFSLGVIQSILFIIWLAVLKTRFRLMNQEKQVMHTAKKEAETHTMETKNRLKEFLQ